VPKKIRQDFTKETRSLVELWYDTIYCDENCIHAYLDSELAKPEYAEASSIVLLDSITKRSQKTFYITEKLTNKTALADLHKKMFEYIAINPKYFIIDSAYKKNFGIILEKTANKPLNQASISTFKIHTSKNVPISRTVPVSPLVKTFSTHSSVVKQAATGQQLADRSIFVDKLLVALTDRYNNTSAEIKSSIKDLNIKELSNAIEVGCYEYLGMDTKKYRTRMISILSNVKSTSNNSFYLKVLCGNFKPDQLAKIGIEEMADDRLNKERLKQREEVRVEIE